MVEGKFKETNIGCIPENWETVPLTDIVTHYVDNRGKTAPTTESGIPLIATNCIKEQGLYPTYERLRFVSKETHETWFRDHPKPDDIIIVNKGTPGLVCLVPNPADFCIAQDMIAIRADKSKVYYKYLFAYMRTENFKYQVQNLNVGTTIPHLKKTVFSNLIIPLPSVEEQIFIGNLYYEISKKFELNQKINQTLEALGQAIFIQWFIDFEFPDEKGQSYKSSGGEMIDSKLGEIPNGWEVKKLGEICDIKMGQSPKSEFYNENGEGLPFYQGVTNFGERFPKDKMYCTVKNKVAEKGDILFSVRAPVGRINIANTKMIIGRGICAIKHKNSLQSFLLYQLKNIFTKEDSIGSGTVFNAITRKDLDELLVLVPNININKKFDSLTGSIDKEIENLTLQNNNLSQIRDSILPKLMSGKIRVN
ncbi:MAG: hypothetical protein CIT01_00700 [Methanobacterium sp. BRmetb2]|nr:MAG: hypothetical protein CIT01_00700 [Methanobacterium sp. BRmetb2]